MTLARMGEVLSSPACMVLSETTGIDAGKAMICLMRWIWLSPEGTYLQEGDYHGKSEQGDLAH